MSEIAVKVPDIGEIKDVEVIEILIKPGDMVEVGQSLITVESDKASMEIPSDHAGIVQEVEVKLGDKVSEGVKVLILKPVDTVTTILSEATPIQEAKDRDIANEADPVNRLLPMQPPAPTVLVQSGTNDTHNAQVHASPSVRKFSRELGVDLAKTRGSGPKGRILHADVQDYVKAVVAGAPVPFNGGASSPSRQGGCSIDLLPWPSLDFSKFGPTELQPLSRIKKISGPNLHRNWVMIPHVTQFDEADVTELEEFRKECNSALGKSGVKVTMLAFVIKASVAALRKFPTFNASLDASGGNLILKKYYNVGFAADTPNGLVVPVIKNVDSKNITEIALEMADLSAQARDGKLKATDMQGATFTISSLGGIGGKAFTPIINAPEVAILGLARAELKPVWDGKQFLPRLMIPMCLSYDHRVIDGATGARFSSYVATVLSDLRKTLL